MTQAEILKEMLRFYRLEKPAPPEIHKQLLKDRRKTFNAILKKQGKYSLFLSPVLFLFFLVKRFGLTLSIAKCAVIVGTAAALTLGAVSISTYFGITSIIKEKPSTYEKPLEEKTEIKVKEKAFKEEKSQQTIKKYPFFKVRLLNGKVVSGHMISGDKKSIQIREKSGKVIKIKTEMIWKIEKH